MNAVVYESRMDRWVVAISLLVIGTGLFAAVLLAEMPGPVKWFLFVGLLVLTVALPASLLLNTHYVLTDRALRIQSGPFGWDIRLTEIHVIETTREVDSERVPTMNCVRVAHGDGVLLLSPYDAPLFVQDLQVRCDRCHSHEAGWPGTLRMA